MKKFLLICTIFLFGFLNKVNAADIYWAEAHIIIIEGCCMKLRISVYQLYEGQTRLVFSGNTTANLFGEENCCPVEGIDPNDPNNSAGFYDFYMESDENQTLIDDAVALAILEGTNKKDFTPTQNLKVTVYPNPANLNITLNLGSAELQWVKYTIFNSAGEPIILQDRRPFEGGIVEVPLNRIDKSGIYFIEIDINGVRDIRKIEVVR